MRYQKAIEIHQVICDKFFFNRKKVETFAGGFDEEPEPEELVYDIFTDVIGISIIKLVDDRGFGLELLSTKHDLYLSPVIHYFDLENSDIIVTFSNAIELQAKRRPLVIGCSIGPLNEQWRGTLGCFVKDIDDDSVYILSNHHVLYSELGHKDNFIVQPSNYDGGGTDDAIGMYIRSLRPDVGGVNEFDAAIAGPISVDFSKVIPHLGVETSDLIESVS